MTHLSPDFLGKLAQLTGTPPILDLDSVPDGPREMFSKWFQEAVDAGVEEPKAMTLATVDADGLPDARTVDLFSVDDDGWSFVTGIDSVKSSQLGDNPLAALNFWWQPLVRSVRVRGTATASPLGDDAQQWHIQPSHVEFWQSNSDRETTRIRYEKSGGEWIRSVGE